MRGRSGGGLVGSEAVRLIDGDIEPVGIGVVDLQVFAVDTAEIQRYEALVDAHAVLDMHDVLPFLEISERAMTLSSLPRSLTKSLADSKELAVGKHKGQRILNPEAGL